MTRSGRMSEPASALPALSASMKAWYTSLCTMANFTPGSLRSRRTFSAEPAEGSTASSMSADGATNFAMSRPIWM